eukprot:gnl/TRDRNA2_/TRDRNA2_48900_c1_seq1.p2 gnl/TRDRNA2_/TRDRNA2_48900_c1~~gnl/TRDRNA2_/TRDRNA2_48900_c1_seq1.p2  ORF type:complete len:101 (+),score=15.47 gnl/TRDRNA2_/TRDRNA2_48900_c1_seq1:212-514(+)
MPLLGMLGRSAERHVGHCSAQEIVSIAWALTTAGQQSGLLSRATQRRLDEFNGQNLRVALWALSANVSLKGAWRLFDHVKLAGVYFSPLFIGTLVTTCEQ